ncbi:hypothetical protein [Parabacteroides sp. Marseille-P3160]|uniref:hypothetical protein n=1 Tax=Parabacteroides sp. Marseille-P3160 TaxID=1917887 RepID=UPI0009BC62F3|nr:hypothetical protein [Parabacteroides sp. Marseille-P3160]
MLGFELKIRDKILYLPFEASFIISRKSTSEEEDMYINVGLYDPLTNNIVNWVKENLYLNDSIEITLKQIEKTSAPLKIFDFHEYFGTTKEEADKKTLERFLILKEELKNEGLI